MPSLVEIPLAVSDISEVKDLTYVHNNNNNNKNKWYKNNNSPNFVWFTGNKTCCTIWRPFWFAMVVILNPKWPPKYKNPLIWAKFGF
jgi:hypothetical protein